MSSIYPEAVNCQQDEQAFLSRAASYNHLPDLAAAESCPPSLRRTFSDLTYPNHSDSPSKEDVAAGKDILRRTSLRSKEKTTIAVSRFTVSSEDLTNPVDGEPLDPPAKSPESSFPETPPVAEAQTAETQPPEVQQVSETPAAPEPVTRPSKARSMSGRLANLARKPWTSSSGYRSPAPSAKNARVKALRTEDPSSPSSQPSSPKTSTQLDSAPAPDPGTPSRKRTILNKRPRRPTVAVVTQSRGDSPSTPSSPSPHPLATKTSLERLTASLNVSTPVLPPMPKLPPSVAHAHAGIDVPRKKDELWAVFRGLEADFQKFQAKSSALKANVIRSSLLPFLNRNHSNPSYKSLRPEDLDRRVNILNKWWTGLLEMLNGKHNQSISGTDRPVYLEAVVGIMTRPEWRIPFPVPPSDGRSPKPLQHASTSISESSEGSSGSDFLVESIHHNIRNIFTQNLLSQMSFVVERMSMRHAPASLVAFCGKACAYAFFFCPGVADVLVRLWNTPPSVFRRIFAQSNVDRSSATRAFTQDLALNFPLALRPLAFHAHTHLVRYLRQKPDVPLSTAQLPWQSPWVSRWCGRDSDLFFVFIKYIHILYADALPSDIDKGQRLLAPGLLPVHSQLLVVLEDTLYKQSIPQAPENTHTAAAITFDDFIEGADAAVSALPLGGANSHRSMAENRLVILLRDFLSESSVEPKQARLLYAESFSTIMKTAAQMTSLFDHNACFLLCDFVEEIVPIMTRYSRTSTEPDIFDWNFWLQVCKQMVQSHNSLTEVRVFSFLFAIWGPWTASEERKSDLCLGFLLHEPLFFHYFNHWSPMVRAYFHRLVCWRLGRFNGDPSPLDSKIYETLSGRLHRIWRYFLAFQAEAEESMAAPLSSAPCTPAPGRRIIIIRCDNPLSPANLFVSFDRVVPPVPAEQNISINNSLPKTAEPTPAPEIPPPPKKRWNLLKAMFGASSSTKSSGDTSPTSSSDESDTSGSDTTVTADKCLDGHWRPQNSSGELARPKTAHQPYSFKFSLEWMDRPQWPSRNKRLYSPCIPVAAQLHLQLRNSTAKSDDSESTSDSASARQAEDESKTVDDNVRAESDSASASEKATGEPDLKLALKDTLVASKYAGRALAEWAQIVSECDSFFSRRRDEGVPCDRMVETPTLGVESFRK
ncbi:DUF1765-domain-containing protein [Aspergillus steynii IBT 23096]|uniref:DUF1765-domain-containing protein n=1 Tax=Aspergillus steynii IBT 23096 TaxID=1392250 RepID=A0A2I2GJA2_9EURO|nr:DUF1765-domain-containing protein [Aspergillus steynii IBT 23096]PLB52956.1 DUF1765-domain-containing protein [Aspergillus steynii IBT 23096]